MKRFQWMLWAVALLLTARELFAAAPAGSEGPKPVAVVSLTSYDEVMKDVAFIGGLADRPELDKALEGMLFMVTQGKGLAGIDKTRPWGVLAQGEGDQVYPVVFLPVANLKELLKLVEPYAEVKPTEAGEYKITPRNNKKSIYAKQQNGWVFLSEKVGQLAQLPADPATVLGKSDKDYLVTARISLTNLPAALREKARAGAQKGAERDAQRRPDESNAEFAARQKITAAAQKAILELLDDLDLVTIGWAVDRTAEKSFLDLSVTARPGTNTAQAFALQEKLTTDFEGFRAAGAALTASWSRVLPASAQELLSLVVEGAKAGANQKIERENAPADETQLAKDIVGNLSALADKTIKSGRCDGGLSVLLDPEAATLLAGTFIADGSLLDKALQSTADLAKKKQPAVAEWIKFDAENYKSVRFHTLSIPIPPDAKDRAKVVRLIGEKLDVVVGIADKGVYVAAGRDAMAKVKQAIDTSAAAAGHSATPGQVSLALEPVARVSAALGEESERGKAAMIDAELKKLPGEDHITLVMRAIPGGITVRLELERGIVRLLGRLGVMAAGASSEGL